MAKFPFHRFVFFLIVISKESSLGFYARNQHASSPRSEYALSTNIFLSGGAASNSDTFNPSFTFRTMELTKPMGLLLEEVDENSPQGVQVAGMSFGAAQASREEQVDLCIGDILTIIDNQDCSTWTFDKIMEALAEAESPVCLQFKRDSEAVAVRFSQNGVAVAAKPGTPFGILAAQAKVRVPYSCRNGGCGTCEQILLIPGQGEPRYIRPCVARVPKGQDRMTIITSDRYDPNN